MRNIDCRNVRRQIEEAGTADLLSSAVHVHLQSCSACESLARQQTNLHAILSSLETVEAPGDFGFRVKARLAAERQAGSSFGAGNFSFGYRAVAVSMVLFIVAAAFVFVSFRSGVEPTVVKQVTSNPEPASNAGVATPDSKAIAPDVVATKETEAGVTEAVAVERTPKRHDVKSNKGSRIGTRDFSSTQAAVLKGSNELAEGQPAFPINASYQSLKVSVDDARGSSRTISLPTVSFGSQRTLSQNAQPLLASARGAW